MGNIRLVLLPSDIVGLLRSTKGQGQGGGWIAGSGSNDHVPFSIGVGAAVGVTLVAEKTM